GPAQLDDMAASFGIRVRHGDELRARDCCRQDSRMVGAHDPRANQSNLDSHRSSLPFEWGNPGIKRSKVTAAPCNAQWKKRPASITRVCPVMLSVWQNATTWLATSSLSAARFSSAASRARSL